MVVPESLLFRLSLVVGVLVIGEDGLSGVHRGIHLSIRCDGSGSCLLRFVFVRNAICRCSRGRYRLAGSKLTDRTMGEGGGEGEGGGSGCTLRCGK